MAFLTFKLVANASEIDSLKKAVATTYGDERQKSEARLAILMAKSYPDSSIQIADSLLGVARWNQIDLKALCYLAIGEANYSENNFEKASVAYLKSSNLFENNHDTSKVADLANYLGLVYYFQAKFDSAMIMFQKMLKLKTQLHDDFGIAKAHQNIGLVFYYMDDLNSYYLHNKIALRLYEKLNKEKYIAEVANNLAIAYSDEKKYEKAFSFYNMALNGFEKIGDDVNKANVLANLGSLFYHQEDYSKALEYLNRSIDAFKKLDNKIGLIHAHSRLGDVYLKKNQKDLAIKEYLYCEELNKNINVRDVRLKNLYSLNLAYREMNDFENALRVSDEYYELRDSIYDEEKLKTILTLDNEFKVQQSQQELIAIKAKNKAKNLIFIIVVVVAVAGVFIMYLWSRQRRLKENQRLLNLEQKVLRSQMSPHFLFNALSTIQYFILENKNVEAIEYLGDFSKLIRLVLQSSQEEYITLETEKSILENYLSLVSMRFENRLKYIIHFDDNIDVSKTLIPPMLAQPFIENSIEHGELGKIKDGNIWVSFSIEDSLLKFRIQDDGIGIEKSIEKKNGGKHKSMAIILTKERLRLINAAEDQHPVQLVIEDLSRYGKNGTLVEFTIPFHQLN